MNIHDLERLIRRYLSRGILLDTNLLLVELVGSHSPEMIPRFKRTSAYSMSDFMLLETILCRFERIATTPGILTEVSNLLGQLPLHLRKEFFQHFGIELSLLWEEYRPSRFLSDEAEFSYLGLTDTGVIDAAQRGYLVLTNDAKLRYSLIERKLDVVLFNEIRELKWANET